MRFYSSCSGVEVSVDVGQDAELGRTLPAKAPPWRALIKSKWGVLRDDKSDD